MAETSVTQRFHYAKKKTQRNLSNIHKLVLSTPEPVHFYCPKINMFIRVEVNGLPDDIKLNLIEFKNNCSKDTTVQVHVFRKYHQKPEIIEIKESLVK